MKTRASLDKFEVFRIVRLIPSGMVATYGDVAAAAGRPGAARAVGRILSRNPFPGKVPCHRVVRADGRLGGYFGSPVEGARRKADLLSGEGVPLVGGPIPRIEPGFAGRLFASGKPFAGLRARAQ